MIFDMIECKMEILGKKIKSCWMFWGNKAGWSNAGVNALHPIDSTAL